MSTARRYAGGRYLDVADVLAVLAETRRRGRPRRAAWKSPSPSPSQSPSPSC
jgi:hypothetical protein